MVGILGLGSVGLITVLHCLALVDIANTIMVSKTREITRFYRQDLRKQGGLRSQ